MCSSDCVGVNIGADHRFAFAPETESTRPADPATRTSNERDLPLDPDYANSPDLPAAHRLTRSRPLRILPWEETIPPAQWPRSSNFALAAEGLIGVRHVRYQHSWSPELSGAPGVTSGLEDILLRRG